MGAENNVQSVTEAETNKGYHLYEKRGEIICNGNMDRVGVKQRSSPLKRKLASVGISFLALSGCLVVSPNFYEAGNWPRERSISSECAEEARAMGLRRIDVEPARPAGRGEWEAIIHATDSAGRDVRLRCSYASGSRRVTVDRLDR
jgi:hypothetical protein